MGRGEEPCGEVMGGVASATWGEHHACLGPPHTHSHPKPPSPPQYFSKVLGRGAVGFFFSFPICPIPPFSARLYALGS